MVEVTDVNYQLITLFSLCQCQFTITLRELENSSYPQFVRKIYTIIKKYYQGEPVNIHIRSSINIIQDKNWVITTKRG